MASEGDEVLLWVPKGTLPPVRGVDDGDDDRPDLKKAQRELITGDSFVMKIDVVERKPTKVGIGLLGDAAVRGLSAANIASPSCPPTDMQRCNSRLGTIYDIRMGHAQPQSTIPCQTCGLDYLHCPGHMGHIDLLTPILNPLFVPYVCHILQTLCVVCHRLRISPYFLLAQHPLNPAVATHEGRLRRLKEIANLCSRYPRCQFCHATTLVFRQRGLCIQAAPVPKSGELGGQGFVGVPVPPGHIFSILTCVSDFELQVLGLNPIWNHPSHAVMNTMVVLPPIARPTMQTTNSKTGQPFVVEDATIGLYRQILQHNEAMRTTHNTTTMFSHFLGMQHAYERIVLDQGRLYQYGGPLVAPPQPGITKTAMRRRLVGKTGQVRRDLMGKRVNFSTRTVATCDSTLAADEISIPLCMAAQMTTPQQVQPFNETALRDALGAGLVTHIQKSKRAGRIAVESVARWFHDALLPTDSLLRAGRRWRLFKSNNDPAWTESVLPLPPHMPHNSPLPIPSQQRSQGLLMWDTTPLCRGDWIIRRGRRLNPCSLVCWPSVEEGDILWVIPRDGDPVLVNRQPTLVQESMLAMRIRLSRENLSFGLSCASMEAMRGDYDGDEINVHFLQDLGARTELLELLAVGRQIVTGQAARPVIKPIQDAVAAWFWLTHWPDASLGRDRFQQLAANVACMSFGDLLTRLGEINGKWGQFCALHPTHHAVQLAGEWEYSGLALFSLCLPPGFGSLECPVGESLLAHFVKAEGVPNFGRVLTIWRGILIQGPITATSLGGKGGVLHHVALDHGPRAACDFLTRIQCLAQVVTLYGYSHSVGLDDCLLPAAMAHEAHQIMERNMVRLRALPEEARNAVERRIAARAEAEAYLVSAMFRVGIRRVPRGGARVRSLANHNQMGLLCMLGTKGSISNYMQCTLCLGQQVIEGGVLDLSDPTTFYTLRPADDLVITGLIWMGAFCHGLLVIAFYIHATAGREALVEGATNTSDSGYAMRLGVKSMERDIVAYDHTIRVENGLIVQFAYNYNSGRENQWTRPDGAFIDMARLLVTPWNHKAD